MKNIFLKSAALIAALAMTMSGCSNEELTDENGQSEVKGISSITLETPQGGPSTRLEYNTDNITQALGVKWKAGKWTGAGTACERALVVSAAYGNLYGRALVRIDGGGATSKAEFKFSLLDESYWVPVENSIGLLYPHKSDYSGSFGVSSDAKKVEATLPLSGQTGVLADMQNFDYMTASAASLGETHTDANLNMTFKHRIAVMRLTGLTFPEGTTGTATSIAISGTGLKTDAVLTFTKGSNNTLTESLVLGNTEGAITTTGTFNIANNVLDDVYICFFPGNADATGTHQITDLKVTATVGSDTYEYNYGADATVTNKVEKFAEGKMYTLKDKTMTKKAVPSPILVTNLDFENWSDGKPTGWNVMTGSICAKETTDTNGKTSAVKITQEAEDTAAKVGQYVNDLSGNTSYTVSFKYKVLNTNKADTSFRAYLRWQEYENGVGTWLNPINDTEKNLMQSNYAPDNLNQWSTYTTTITAPAKTTTIHVDLRVYNGAAVLVNDVSVKKN